MRLALVIASLGDGGAERVMSLLANFWADRGDEVTLITLESTAIDAYQLDERITRVALGVVQDSAGISRALANNWRRITSLRTALKATGATVVLSFEDRTNVLVVCATLGLRVRRVLSERTDPGVHSIGRVWSILRRLAYPLADALVVQTARLVPWGRRTLLGQARVYAIPNPLRTLRAVEPAASGPEPRVVALGRLWEEKGHDVLLRAFARLAAEFPRWRLTIIGEGPERDSLTALAHTLGIGERLTLAGWLPVPEEVLAKSAVFVMASRYEGFSNALLEAMGAGLPVISTMCGGSEEMITHGDNGLLVAIDDVDQLASAMRQLMQDEGMRERMGRSALAVSQRYTPTSVMPMWDAVLESPRTPAAGHEARSSVRFPDAPKIMFLTRQLDVGGAQRQLVELAAGLHGAGWRVSVATFYRGGAMAERLEQAGVPIVSLEKSGRWDILGFALRLVRLVRREKPDILHGYLGTSNLLLAALRLCFGRARIVWGVRASNMDMSHYDALASLESRLGSLLSRFADLIICNSAAGKAFHLKQGYPADRMTVIPNGIDVTRFFPDAATREARRREWGVAADEILIGIVARLDPMKDHPNFLQAAARVAAVRHDARFICIGDGPAAYREALMDEARALGLEDRVIWPGARDDMHEVYNALDVAVSSSSFGEGFPNTIVEAMASGVLCVVTDVGDSAAIVGELGWVCPPRDSTALGHALVRAIAALPCDARLLREHVSTAYNSTILLERTVAQLAPLIPHPPVMAGAYRWRHK